MNLPSAAAFLCMALLPLAALAADPEPKPEPAPAAPAKPAEEPKYGTFALDANGNKVTGDALAKLSPEAKWAMEVKGYSPVLGPNGEVLGYDDGKMCILPDAVGKDYAAAAKENMLPPGAQGPCPANFPSCHSPEAALPPPPTEAAADIPGQIPAEPGGKNHCDQPGPPPPCAPKPPDSPEQIAERERQEAEKKNNEAMAEATKNNDVNAMASAIDESRRIQADSNKTAYNDPMTGGGLGTKGTQDASAGPGPGFIGSTGGQGIGAEGQVGTSGPGGNQGGGLSGREVQPDSRALAQSVIDMNNGMANGSLGPGDPNVRSVAQRASQGLSGSAFESVRSLAATLKEKLFGAEENPDTDLTAGFAVSPVDGSRSDQPVIAVKECEATESEALGSKGKKVRKLRC